MTYKKRLYGLGIWGLGLGYYLFYTPYSGLTKALSSGIIPGIGMVPGPVLLPASAIATAVCMYGFITVMGWWKYAGHRNLFGVRVPVPQRLTFLSGICMATIIGTTTLAFTFGGVSIILVLVLLRGGILVIAPTVDAITKRRVRWFSWAAMLFSMLAVLVILADASSYSLTLAAMADVTAYLAAYFFKLQFMTRLSKSDERDAARRYFVEEQIVATPFLILALGVMAAIGAGDVMTGFRLGFTTFLLSGAAAGMALLVGLFYAALCVCTTFIFLDHRENTFCVPMHCGSSMLSGVTAAYILALFFKQPTPSAAQLASAGLIIVALAFLSPLHHFRLYLDKLARLFGFRRAHGNRMTGSGKEALESPGDSLSPSEMLPASLCLVSEQERADKLRRIFLFVCSGNTCRSPMAAAIGNAHIASRLKIPFEALDSVGMQALSAGVSARAGAPMTHEARQILDQMDVPVPQHAARNLTVELAHQVEMIFCMTRAHHKAVIETIPSAAEKTYCLDPEGDIEDPIGGGLEDYLRCARHIHRLVSWRLDEAMLSPSL